MPMARPPSAMAGVSLSSLNTRCLCVRHSRMTKNTTPMAMRPMAISAPTESEPFRPIVESNMFVRVAQRLNSGTHAMPVADMSMKMVPFLRSIW